MPAPWALRSARWRQKCSVGPASSCAAASLLSRFRATRVARLTGVALADGTEVEADVAVVALGAIRNTEWLAHSGLAAGPLGLSVDAGGRANQVDGLIDDDVFAAGDVARFPHALFGYEFLALEHWENALVGAQIAAHNMICAPRQRRAHVSVPIFLSVQFETNIKSVGVPALVDQIVLTQGCSNGSASRPRRRRGRA